MKRLPENGDKASQDDTIMASTTSPSSQAAAKGIHADVTIVMAGGLPPEQPQAAVKAVGRLDIGGNIAIPPTPDPLPQQALPPLTTQTSNLFQSVVAFVGDGCGIVDDTTYQRRLDICCKCDRLSGNRCVACGCFIYVKARGRIFHCPIGRW